MQKIKKARSGFFTIGCFKKLIECIARSDPEEESIEHNDKTRKAKPGEYFKVILYDGMPQVLECLEVNFFDK